MSKVINVVLGTLFGAAVGGGVAYVYLNAKYSKVIDIECQSYQDEITSLRQQVGDLQKQVVTKLDEAKESIANEQPVEVDPAQLSIDDISVEEEEGDEDEGYDAEPTSKSGNVRYIGEKDYEDDEDYEKEVFYYFSGDSIFTQDDEILDDEEVVGICGKDAVNKIKHHRDIRSIYVRNEDYNTDYKIKRYNMTYEKYINGLNNR